MVELAGTTFTAIPHDSLMDEPGMDHDILVKKKPMLAARLLDRYRKMVGSLYNTHQVLVEDKAEMLDDLTDTTRRQERAQMTRQESEGSHFSPVVGTHSYPTQPGPSGIHLLQSLYTTQLSLLAWRRSRVSGESRSPSFPLRTLMGGGLTGWEMVSSTLVPME
jgi:hypothetical protein